LKTDYVDVTEIAGDEVSQEQIERLCRRYYWAGEYCRDRDVLEVACGSGQGLGYLAGLARSLRAGDISAALVRRARDHYGGRVQVSEMNAMSLPFADESLDVVILFEAIYYLPDAGRFASEAYRVLRPGGYLLIATANKDLYDFNPSPHSVHYFGVIELAGMLQEKGYSCAFYGDTPVKHVSLRQRVLRPLKRLAARYRLIPSTMAAKKLLKRMVFGRLLPMPAEIGVDTANNVVPGPISPGRPDYWHKVIFCEARKPDLTGL
jgi:SAM-dependent methyltransferase